MGAILDGTGDDVTAAFEFLKAHPKIDAVRTGVVGAERTIWQSLRWPFADEGCDPDGVGNVGDSHRGSKRPPAI